MSEFEQLPDIENLSTSSPEDVAKKIFSSVPQSPGSICILPYSNNTENDAVSFNFEILLTIYMEGFMNILDVIKNNYLEQNPEAIGKKQYELENLIYADISDEDLKFPEPWFKSFGYNIDINDVQSVKMQPYCRILLSFDPKDRIHFLMKEIKSRYHFILSRNYKPTNDIKKIYACLQKGKKTYYISFKPFGG